MADTMRLVEYYYVMVPNKPGEAVRLLDTLRQEDVNLLAFSVFPEGRRAQIGFIPADAAAFRQAAKKAKWKLARPKRGFLMQGDDRVGAVADLLDRLAAAKINVAALDAICADGWFGVIFWVEPRDVKKTAALLGCLPPWQK